MPSNTIILNHNERDNKESPINSLDINTSPHPTARQRELMSEVHVKARFFF